MKKFLGFLFVLMLALFSVACSGDNDSNAGNEEGKSAKSSEEAGDKEITIAIDQNFITLDPHNAGDTVSIFGIRSMYEGLVSFDENMEIVPALAESYEISDDALTYTFKLREDVTFHDGEPFNAEAVKVNFDRIMDDANNLSAKRSLQFVDSLEVINDNEVAFKLNEPFSAMINKFAMVPMISPKAIEEGTKYVEGNPVGTGTFKFVEWKQGTILEVEKNEDYWGGDQTNVAKVIFSPVPENGSRVAMLKTGEADFVYPMPQQNVKEFENSDDVTIDESPSTIARYVSINTFKDPYSDLKVRQAMNHAVDKEAYLQVVKDGFGHVLDSTMSSETQYYSKQEPYEFDIEKAKALLKEAGYEDGFEAEIWGNTSSETIKGMEFIKQQLAQVNIDVTIKSMEEGTLSDEIYTPEKPEDAKVQMWYVSWSPSSGDADGATRGLFSSEYFPPNGANTAYFDNDQVTNWIKEANATADTKKQEEIYTDLQRTVYSEAPWIFLATDINLAGRSNNLEGVYVAPDGSVNISKAQVK
ncbi:glutathione ABC transporter substrate-binding protein [Pseudogracilibacillus auburnensis]|uniref:glutathione ABC transporter substrate-binding protein n=1 Tax=Pseudogracilibacillus auburnensis TaxID=1494959 RepID=UPI001A97604B|nr:glutathione ABC transporter substrate-binding protein [Pseudogracilibacillus auburnensis]MBO1001875.1 glutathione ABC transporter substrate-binding protein [Pseudogracilibacillus auburnensis]